VDENTLLIDHFCRRGTSDKDPSKPARSVLLQLLLKDKVASGKLVIDRFEEGIPILIRGSSSEGPLISPPTGEDDELATLLRGIMSYLGKRQL
jgi:hypothetical protein